MSDSGLWSSIRWVIGASSFIMRASDGGASLCRSLASGLGVPAPVGPAARTAAPRRRAARQTTQDCVPSSTIRSEEHTSELQSRSDLVCRLLLEKKKKKYHLHHYKRNSAQNII